MPYDLVIVYPATMNTICKIAQGIADNVVTVLCSSTDPTKLLIAPAMNLKLYLNKALEESMERLRRLGATILEPRIDEGAAKVPSVEATVDHSARCLSISALKDRGVLILAGPTRYDLDPVRYISNKATGRIGYWLAKEAFRKGCKVKVICGPGSVSFPTYIPVKYVYTADDMLREALKELENSGYEVVVFSAAILDFKPAVFSKEKVKSGSPWRIEFKPTPKVIEEVSRKHPNLTIVAFKLEYRMPKEKLMEKAYELLKKVNAALVVANDLSEIRGKSHKAYIINRNKEVKCFDGSKGELAQEILNLIEEELLTFNRR